MPTNLKNIRIDHEDEIYRTKKEKIKAVINLIKENHAKQQPTLIGTTSVENSEIISTWIGGVEYPVKSKYDVNIYKIKKLSQRIIILINEENQLVLYIHFLKNHSRQFLRSI